MQPVPFQPFIEQPRPPEFGAPPALFQSTLSWRMQAIVALDCLPSREAVFLRDETVTLYGPAMPDEDRLLAYLRNYRLYTGSAPIDRFITLSAIMRAQQVQEYGTRREVLHRQDDKVREAARFLLAGV